MLEIITVLIMMMEKLMATTTAIVLVSVNVITANNLLQISRDLSVTKFLGYPEFSSQSLKELF